MKFIYILFLTFGLALTLPDQEKFLQSVESYNSGQVSEAKEILNSIAKKNGAVFYNLGNCQYHLKNYPQAILNWRKAQVGTQFGQYLKLETLIAKAEENLKINSGKTAKTYLLALASGWSTLAIQLLLLLFWILFLINIFYFKHRFRVLVAVFLFSFILLVGFLYFYKSNHRFVVPMEPINLMAGPKGDYHALEKIPAGAQLE